MTPKEAIEHIEESRQHLIDILGEKAGQEMFERLLGTTMRAFERMMKDGTDRCGTDNQS